VTSPCIHSSRGSRESIDIYLRVVPTCLKQTSGRPRAKVELRWGHMSGGSMTISFSNTASSAWICAPPTHIQKLVRLQPSQCAFCFSSISTVCSGHSPLAVHRRTDFVAPHPTESKEYEQICNGRKFSVAIGLYCILEGILGEFWERSE